MKKLLIFVLSVSLFFVAVTPTSQTQAEPILKARKYHGPIPRRSLTFHVGFLGGPSADDLFGFLDRGILQTFRSELVTQDFSSALQLDVAYTAKVHPNFAFRFKTGVGFLTADSRGLTQSTEADTTGTLILQFDRKFEVLLASVEASGLYYFQDASVKEFQTYFGGGFSLYLPFADWKETLSDSETGVLAASTNVTDSGNAPGVHAVFGMLYHFQPQWAFHVEGRAQLSQSKFTLDLPTADAGIQPLSFDIDYTGFVLTAGFSRFF